MAQRLLVFGAVITGLRGLKAGKAGDDIALTLLAFELHIPPAARDERATMLGDGRAGKRGIAGARRGDSGVEL